MRVQIKVTKQGKPLKSLLTEQLKVSSTLRAKFMALGIQVSAEMKNRIRTAIKRPGSTGRLVNSITYEPLKDGWGVGNTSTMPIYWRAFNWGSAHLVGKHLPVGGFNPGNPKPSRSDFRAGRWEKGKGKGNFSPIIKKPIPATNFLENTVTWVHYKVLQLLGGIK